MSDTIRVLSIDDDSTVQNVIRKTLKDEYEVITANCGEEGVELALQSDPDLILLDVEMPRMNGYETCDKLKLNKKTKDIPILFLSSLTDMRSRVLGFEAGATDFLVKPFNAKELLTKVDTIGTIKKSEEELLKQVKIASETAFTAMRGSSEMGVSIGYIERSLGATTDEELASEFLKTTAGFGLNCTLMFLSPYGAMFFNTTGSDIAPLEKEVMQTIHASGKRFTDFGCRTQVNYPHSAVLIKNMPLDDMEAYGRYKDFLPSMLGATDSRLINLQTELALIDQTKNITSSFDSVQQTLQSITDLMSSNQKSLVDLLKNMLSDLDERIPLMGLDDDQEAYLIKRVDSTVTEAYSIIDQSTETNLAFTTVNRLLQHLAEQQRNMLSNLYDEKNVSEKYLDDSKKMTDSSAGEIDLF